MGFLDCSASWPLGCLATHSFCDLRPGCCCDLRPGCSFCNLRPAWVAGSQVARKWEDATLRLGCWSRGRKRWKTKEMRPCDLATRSLGREVAKGGKPRDMRPCDLATRSLGRRVAKCGKLRDMRPCDLATRSLGRWVVLSDFLTRSVTRRPQTYDDPFCISLSQLS